MSKTVQIKDIDRGYRDLMRRLDRAARLKPEVVVGVLGDDAGKSYTDGTTEATVGDIAFWHELGLGTPRRSWLRDWYDEQLPKNKKAIRALAIKVLKGEMDERKALEVFGIKAVSGIRKRIRSGIAPPLSEATVARRGPGVPLIDTAQFIQSITHEVRP
jgi:hypothetical protein